MAHEWKVQPPSRSAISLLCVLALGPILGEGLSAQETGWAVAASAGFQGYPGGQIGSGPEVELNLGREWSSGWAVVLGSNLRLGSEELACAALLDGECEPGSETFLEGVSVFVEPRFFFGAGQATGEPPWFAGVRMGYEHVRRWQGLHGVGGGFTLGRHLHLGRRLALTLSGELGYARVRGRTGIGFVDGEEIVVKETLRGVRTAVRAGLRWRP